MQRFGRNSQVSLLTLAAIVATTPATSFAQGIITGSLTGLIADPSGAVVAGATVVATNSATQVKFTQTTNSRGEVSFPTLPTGTYTVTVESGGFATLTVNNVVVRTGDTVALGTQKLAVNTSEEVEVSSSQSLLETNQAQVTTTIESQQITDLPSGGGIDRLVLLVPGVVRTLGNNYANTNGTGLSANGLRGRSNNFEIDGQTNNDNSISGPQFFFRNEDALSELQIVSNNFGAQYGRNAGQVVNYLTKSGTNTFHGTAFENYLGSWGSSLLPGQKNGQFGFCYPGQTSTAALPCTTPVVPRVTANEYGGTFGGPLYRDKLFFFGGTLFRKVTNGANPSISTTLTPTPNGIAQLKTAYPNNAFVASLATTGPYSVTAGNPTPGAVQSIRVCPQANTSVCPAAAPAIDFATITRLLPSTSSDAEHIGRLDYQATRKDRFFLRYMYQNAPTYVANASTIAAVAAGAYYDNFDVVHSAAGDWSRTFSPRVLNQLRYSFQQSTLTFGGGGYPNCKTTSLASCPANIAVGSTAFANGSAIG